MSLPLFPEHLPQSLLIYPSGFMKHAQMSPQEVRHKSPLLLGSSYNPLNSLPNPSGRQHVLILPECWIFIFFGQKLDLITVCILLPNYLFYFRNFMSSFFRALSLFSFKRPPFSLKSK